jgi:hypothetical protein
MESLKARTKLVSELQRTVRGAYLKGKVSALQAQQILTEGGVAPNMIQAEMQMWTLEMMRQEKHLSVAQIRKAVVDGTMDPAEARIRITNLGFPDADVQILMQEIQAQADLAIAKAHSVTDRASLRQQNDLAKAAKAAQAAQQEAIRAMQKQEPVSKLQKWASLGMITEAYFTQRLLTYGYDPAAIALLWIEACRGKGAECQGAAPPNGQS